MLSKISNKNTLFFRSTQLFNNHNNRKFGLARHPARGVLFRIYFQKEKSIHHSSADVTRVMIRNMTDSWAKLASFMLSYRHGEVLGVKIWR